MPEEIPSYTLSQVLELEAKLNIQKGLALETALKGNDVNQIYQAQSYLKAIEKRDAVTPKSMLVDPLDLSSSFGYKNKPFQLSYDILRIMARTHIVKAIVETRKEQIQNFCEPQANKYATGFIITKKQKYSEIGQDIKLSKVDQKKIEWLVEFLLSCGTASNFWHADTFDVFVSKVVKDSLELDQATFEVQRDRKGDPIQYFATDGGTYRIADTYLDDENNTRYPEKMIQGYGPAYVQLYMTKIVGEFYPWELCFGVLNPTTDINKVGYGKSPLEDMIQTVTAILNADSYNANFFKVGSAPRGILKYSGNINMSTLEDFRQQWIAQVSGVLNAHKVPIINADKLDFINTHVPNKDMEFGKYQEFLVKIACAMYKIDPSEIGFPMSGNTNGSSGLGGDNQEEKVKYSKDKGLKPLLKKIQYWINKYIIWQLDDQYEFRFVGIDEDTDPQTELDQDVELVGNIMTLNEIRKKRNLEPIEGGDIPLNPAFLQAMQMEQQKEMQNQQMQQQQGQHDDQMGVQKRQMDQQDEDEDPFGSDTGEEDKDDDNPFTKSLAKELEVLLCNE
jgi:hypothetical protein